MLPVFGQDGENSATFQDEFCRLPAMSRAQRQLFKSRRTGVLHRGVAGASGSDTKQRDNSRANPRGGRGGGHTKHNLPMLLLVFFLHGYTRLGRALGKAGSHFSFFFVLFLVLF